MAKPSRAYFLDDRRFTPSQFQRLSRAKKVAAMVEWFEANFEDPANSVSYNSREGGYLWGGNGPHDADEELQDQFSDIADYDTIQEAVSEVTAEGTYQWASSYDPDDYDPDDYGPADDGEEGGDVAALDRPLVDWDFGLAEANLNESDLRAEVLASLERFEAKLDAYTAQRAHRGHNQPPELLEDDDPLTDADIAEGHRAVAEIRAEAVKPEPDASLVARASASIGRIGRKLLTVAKFLGAAIAGNAAYDGASWIYAHQEELYGAAMEAAASIAQWAEHLPAF